MNPTHILTSIYSTLLTLEPHSVHNLMTLQYDSSEQESSDIPYTFFPTCTQ